MKLTKSINTVSEFIGDYIKTKTGIEVSVISSKVGYVLIPSQFYCAGASCTQELPIPGPYRNIRLEAQPINNPLLAVARVASEIQDHYSCFSEDEKDWMDTGFSRFAVICKIIDGELKGIGWADTYVVEEQPERQGLQAVNTAMKRGMLGAIEKAKAGARQIDVEQSQLPVDQLAAILDELGVKGFRVIRKGTQVNS